MSQLFCYSWWVDARIESMLEQASTLRSLTAPATLTLFDPLSVHHISATLKHIPDELHVFLNNNLLLL